jgi:hypothetical protein
MECLAVLALVLIWLICDASRWSAFILKQSDRLATQGMAESVRPMDRLLKFPGEVERLKRQGSDRPAEAHPFGGGSNPLEAPQYL